MRTTLPSPIPKAIAVALALTLLLPALPTLPASAWKVGSHVYSANLILQELNANDGQLEIPPFGQFEVPAEYLAAVQNYPEYYRAGVIGPDAFPDIYVGQGFIHPEDGTNSNDWIEHLWRQYLALPAGTNEKQQVLAFMLGFLTHAAGDLFGHTYVNQWAGGPWPDMTDGLPAQDRENIARHMIVESYMDKMIPTVYQSGNHVSVAAPLGFLYKNTVVNGSPANGLHPIYQQVGSDPIHFGLFLDTRQWLADDIALMEEALEHRFDNWYDYANPYAYADWAFLQAKCAYWKAWRDDIDAGLWAWMEVSEYNAHYLAIGKLGPVKDAIDWWVSEHLFKMAGAPDVTVDTLNALGSLVDNVLNLLPEPLKLAWQHFEDAYRDAVFYRATGYTYTELETFFTNPETWLSGSLFPEGAEAQLRADLGNFDQVHSDLSDFDFAPFYDTLVMAKLVMIGPGGANEVLQKAGLQPLYASSDNVMVGFMRSLDGSYNWQPGEGLGTFPLWNDRPTQRHLLVNIFKSIEPAALESPPYSLDVDRIDRSDLGMAFRFQYPSRGLHNTYNAFWWNPEKSWKLATLQNVDVPGEDGSLYHQVDVMNQTVPAKNDFPEAVFGLVDRETEVLVIDATIYMVPFIIVDDGSTDDGSSNDGGDSGDSDDTDPVPLPGSGDDGGGGTTTVPTGMTPGETMVRIAANTYQVYTPVYTIVEIDPYAAVRERPAPPSSEPTEALAESAYTMIVTYEPDPLSLLMEDKMLVWWNGAEWLLVSDQRIVEANEFMGRHYEIKIGANTVPSLSDFRASIFGSSYSAASVTSLAQLARESLRTYNNNLVTYSLQGSYIDTWGLEAEAGLNSISITWNEYTPPQGRMVIGYRVYRGSFPGETVDGEPLNTAPITELSYTDSGLTEAIEYYYSVRAILDNGSLSNPSQEAGPVQPIIGTFKIEPLQPLMPPIKIP